MYKYSTAVLQRVDINYVNPFTFLSDICVSGNYMDFRKAYNDLAIGQSPGPLTLMKKILPIACYQGKLQIVKFICKNANYRKLHHDNDAAFRKACEAGHLDIVKWLWGISIKVPGTLDIHANNDYGLRWACYGGHLDIALWILEISSLYPSTKTKYDKHCIPWHSNLYSMAPFQQAMLKYGVDIYRLKSKELQNALKNLLTSSVDFKLPLCLEQTVIEFL